MVSHKYRFMLSDGQTFEGTDLRRIRRVHPSARIVARIDFDELGQGVVVPFHDDDDGRALPMVNHAPAESAAAVPSNPKAKKEPKR